MQPKLIKGTQVAEVPMRVNETLTFVPVGFNPFRQQHRSYADYLMVAAALVVCIALVVWALLG
jgi:hypothetical protein